MRKVIASVLLLLCAAGMLSLVMLPLDFQAWGSRRVIAHVRDMGHLPLFGIFTYMLLVWGSVGRRRRWSTGIMAVVVPIAVGFILGKDALE